VGARLAACRGLAGVALLALWASAGLAEPPIPVELGEAGPVALRYRYQPGETVLYRITVDERLTLSDVSTSRRSELSVSGRLTLALVVQRADEAGDVVLTEELREPSFEVRADGFDLTTRELTRAMTGVTRTIELSPRGELVDEESQPWAGPPLLRALAVEVGRVGEMIRLELPEGLLQVGEAFRAEASASGEGAGFDWRQSLSLTFLGWARVGQRRCAVLEVGGDAWRQLASGASVGEIRGPALGRAVYHGYLYFDPEAGRLVRGQVEVGMVGRSGGGANPLDLREQASWTVELVE
jgi:hypothetical protein